MTRPTLRSLRRLVASLAVTGAAAFAQPAGPGIPTTVAATPAAAEQGAKWQSLSAAQRSALAPLQRDWPSIDAPRKQKWLDVATRYQSMSPQERERVQDRMNEWARMTPAERGRARLQFQEVRQLPAQDRQARWDAYQALGPDERRELAAKAPAAGAAASATTASSARAALGSDKRNVVASTQSPATLTKPVAPTVVQARPGATTTLVSKPAQPPAHHQPGLPKIAATRGFVDPATLLPKRGPQGAAIAAAGPAASNPTSGKP